MTRSHVIRMGIAGAALALAIAAPHRAAAQPKVPASAADQQYADWVAMYGHWSPAQAEKAGYLATDVCVTATAVGLPASMGAMGRHFVHPGNIEDGKADVDAPDIVLFDADDRVVGLEFEVLTVVDPIPSVGGVPLARTPADPGVDHEHLSLHVYFVGDPADRYKSWNPAVNCGTMDGPSGPQAAGAGALPAALPDGPAAAGSTSAPSGEAGVAPASPPAASEPATTTVKSAAPEAPGASSPREPMLAAVPESIADGAAGASGLPAPSDASAHDLAPSDGPSDGPANMPVAGAGDWLPGGDAALFALLAVVLVALAAAGRRSAARRA